MSLFSRPSPPLPVAEPEPGPDWRGIADELAERLAASGAPCGRHPATAPVRDCRAAVKLADGVTPYPSLIKGAATGGEG